MAKPGGSQKLHPILKALGDETDGTRQNAVRALRMLPIAYDEAAPALITVLRNDKCDYIRADAAQAFSVIEVKKSTGEINPDVMSALTTALLTDPSDEVRITAARTLVQLSDPDWYNDCYIVVRKSLIRALLKDQNREVRTVIEAGLTEKDKHFVDRIHKRINDEVFVRQRQKHGSQLQLEGQSKEKRSEPAKAAAYEELAGRLKQRVQHVKQQVATELAPALNEHIKDMPHDTYAEKKELSRWVNEELRSFDLAIKCPKTGQPSILLADLGNHPEIGRFQFAHRTLEGKQVRTFSTPSLPDLELLEANPRREAFVEWRATVGRRRGGASRT